MLGPVFRHEMVAAGRGTRYTLLRVVVGLLLLVILVVAYQGARESGEWGADGGGLSIRGASALVSSFYTSFAWTTLLGVVALTPAVAAGAIASERQRRTIEYLFATDLSNSEIVLGKLVARLLVVAQVALAALPFLAIVGLYGGIPSHLLVAHFGVLASTAALVAAIALVASTWSERPRDAVPRSMRLVMAWFLAAPIAWFVAAMIDWRFPGGPSEIAHQTAAALTSVNAIAVVGMAGMVGYQGGLGVGFDARAIAWLVGWQLALAAACASLCVWQVRRVHLRSASAGVAPAPEGAALTSRGWLRRLVAPRPSEPYHDHPVLWKEMFTSASRPRSGRSWKAIGRRLGAIGVALIVFAPIVAQFLIAYVQGTAIKPIDYFATVAGLTAFAAPLVLLGVGARAAGLVSYEKEQDTWLSLISSPLAPSAIVFGKLAGNLYASRWSLLAVVTPALTGLLLLPIAIGSVAALVVVVAVTATSASMVGLAISLRVESSTKAIAMTSAALVAMGGGYYPFAAAIFFAVGAQGEAWLLLFAPCVPFLVAAPALLIVERAEPWAFAAFAPGVCGYAVLSAWLYADAVRRFTDLTGRGEGHDTANAAPAASALPRPAEASPREVAGHDGLVG
ncbi:MAG: ABC transporter permease subunit [Lacipirellulaceae bacterium]